MWVPSTNLPTAASHPFYRRLNQLLREHGFDDFVEAQCAAFYADTMGRPGLPPSVYFRPQAAPLHSCNTADCTPPQIPVRQVGHVIVDATIIAGSHRSSSRPVRRDAAHAGRLTSARQGGAAAISGESPRPRAPQPVKLHLPLRSPLLDSRPHYRADRRVPVRPPASSGRFTRGQAAKRAPADRTEDGTVHEVTDTSGHGCASTALLPSHDVSSPFNPVRSEGLSGPLPRLCRPYDRWLSATTIRRATSWTIRPAGWL